MKNRRNLLSVITVLALLPTAACAIVTPSPGKAAAPATTAPAGTGPVASETPVNLAAATPSPRLTWSTAPVTVVHNPPVPPMPVLTAVRTGAHPAEGFDRIVFDISGAAPGYSVRYVSEVRADPSDQPVAVPGNYFLLIVLHPADAHRPGGGATVSGVHRVNLVGLRAYAIVGDFEGHVSIALGVARKGGFRVAELPGRVYVDVPH